MSLKTIWIHCNICFGSLNMNTKHFILSCSHILCYGCLKIGGKIPTCSKCNLKVSFKEIKKNMEAKYLDMLTLDTTFQFKTFQFQNSHLSGFRRYCQALAKKSSANSIFKQRARQKIDEGIQFAYKLKVYQKSLQAKSTKNINSSVTKSNSDFFTEQPNQSKCSFFTSKSNSTLSAKSNPNDLFHSINSTIFDSGITSMSENGSYTEYKLFKENTPLSNSALKFFQERKPRGRAPFRPMFNK